MADDPGHRHPAPMVLVLALRWLALLWMVTIALIGGQVQHPLVAGVALLAVAGWSVWLTLASVRRVLVVLAVDLVVAAALIVVSGYVYPAQALLTDHPSFMGAYPMAAVAACGIVYRVWGGVAAGLLLGIVLPLAHVVNGAPLGGLSYLQLLSLVSWALSYVLLGGTVGLAAGQLDRLRQHAALAGERAARMAERERLAADIHDDVLQHLGRLRARLRELASRDAGIRLELDSVADAVARQEAALRGLTRPRPVGSVPGEVSLRDRLESVAAQWNVLPVQVTASGPVQLPVDVANEVVAAVQELLTNVAKHARARRVRLTVLEVGSEIAVSVHDDGIGLAADLDTGDHRLGLRLSVRARVERLGGQVSIRSRANRGTEVELRIPASLADHDRAPDADGPDQ